MRQEMNNQLMTERSNSVTVLGPCRAAVELDSDAVDAILVCLIASPCSPSSSPARHLCRCACVCQLWYAASLNEDLWRDLLARRSTCGMLEAGREHAKLSYRAMYIRAATTQMLVWGLHDNATARRTPALLGEDGLKGLSIKQISVGEGFSCAVRSFPPQQPLRTLNQQLMIFTDSRCRRHRGPASRLLTHNAGQLTWGGQVLCWGDNSNGQCGLHPAVATTVSEPATLDFPKGCEKDGHGTGQDAANMGRWEGGGTGLDIKPTLCEPAGSF